MFDAIIGTRQNLKIPSCRVLCVRGKGGGWMWTTVCMRVPVVVMVVVVVVVVIMPRKPADRPYPLIFWAFVWCQHFPDIGWDPCVAVAFALAFAANVGRLQETPRSGQPHLTGNLTGWLAG